MIRKENEALINTLPSISNLRDVNGWQLVEIQENNEPLVCLNHLSSSRIIVQAEYELRGFKTASELQYGRSGVIKQLKLAVKYLPSGFMFKVYDAWRPLELQLEIFNNFLEELKESNAGLSETELVEMCKIFVSLPSSDLDRPSPHYSGGSIDLTLVDASSNKLWMGTEFDDFTEKAGTTYFENNALVTTELDEIARKNRRILFNAMTQVGFSNYPKEWWHYDLGNQFWGKATGNAAYYGPILLTNNKTKI